MKNSIGKIKQTYKILITGIAGLIGSCLAEYLLDQGHAIFGIDNLSGGYISNIPSSVKLFTDDLTEPLTDIFEQVKPDYVYHLAAYAAEGLSPFIRAFNYHNNLIATSRVINECIRFNVKRLVFTSSIAIYGHPDIVPIIESCPLIPNDPYGIAKLACEMDIKVAGKQHNLDWCILRPHNVYGPKQNIWDKYRNVIGIWMYNKLNNDKISIYGDGKQKRAFTYISDILPLFWQSAVSSKASKQIFNIGSDTEHCLNDLFSIFEKITGPCQKEYLPFRHEVQETWCNHEKIYNLLGKINETSLNDGISEMWEWAKVQPQREQKTWTEYELDIGIYKNWKK